MLGLILISGKFIPVHWKELPTDTWNRCGHKHGSCLCQHLQRGVHRNTNSKRKFVASKELEWKRYIDDIFSLWNNYIQGIEQFIERANRFHPTGTRPFTKEWTWVFAPILTRLKPFILLILNSWTKYCCGGENSLYRLIDCVLDHLLGRFL